MRGAHPDEEKEPGHDLVPWEELPAPRWEELPASFREALTRHRGYAEAEFARAVSCLQGLIRRRISDPEERQEAWSLTWLAILQSLDTFQPARKVAFGTWAWAVCARVIAGFYEQKAPLLEPLPEGWEQLWAEQSEPSPSPEDYLIRQEDAARVRQALGQIPAHYQEALHLKYFEEHTYAEIATQLGLQRNQVAQRIRDGLKAFREAYLRLQREEDYGHDLR